MRVLTIKQPWAELIARGEKLIENRTWTTKYRGQISIHAGNALDLDSNGPLSIAEIAALPRGQIVAIAELVDIVPIEGAAGERYATGPYCWRLANVRRIAKPIFIRGKLGLWAIPDEIASKL